MNRQAFGRRASSVQPVARVVRAEPAPAPVPEKTVVAPVVVGAPVVETPRAESTEAPVQSVEDELREWKRERRKKFPVPWRQLSLMASLSFGIGSFVLPDFVDDFVQWPLWILAAISFYVGVSKRGQSGAEESKPS